MRILTCATAVCIFFAPAAIASDSDGDGVPDDIDVCPDTPPGALVDPHGRPAADFNVDCVVNGLDISGFIQNLLTPPAGPAPTTFAMLSPTPELSGYFGVSVAGVSDVDGDGRTDILVGAKLENPTGSPNDCGRVHLYSGKTGLLLRNFASPNQVSDGRFGWGVGAIPDVDGDGRGDIVIGAPFENPSGAPPRSGRAYIFSGATGVLLTTLTSPNATQFGLFGFSVAGIADLNADGRGDVIVGAWHESSPGNPTDSGRAYVFSGATGALLHTLVSPNQTVGGQFGVAAARIPDVNGDGRDDIIIGAAGETPQGLLNAGRAYIFSGADGSLLHSLVSPHAEESGNFGVSVGGVPDVDGDGRGDVVVAASTESSGGGPDSTGRAYIFSGSSGLPLRELDSPHGATFANAVAGVPDIDGDGFADVVIGASNESAAGSPSTAGRAYVFSGATGTLMRELISPNEDLGGLFGYSVAGAADATGDGRGDVIVSALFENPPPNPIESGAAYLFNLADSDADGAPDDNDQCPNTPAGTPVDLHGRPAADFNGDCEVTTADIPGFANMLLAL